MDEVTVNGGKYTFYIPENDWRVHCLRYGEAWMIFEEGTNAIASLMREYNEECEKKTTV